jgi:hypothetical protein
VLILLFADLLIREFNDFNNPSYLNYSNQNAHQNNASTLKEENILLGNVPFTALWIIFQ